MQLKVLAEDKNYNFALIKSLCCSEASMFEKYDLPCRAWLDLLYTAPLPAPKILAVTNSDLVADKVFVEC